MADAPAPCLHRTYSPGCLRCEVDYLQRYGDTLTPGDCCRRCGRWERFCTCGDAKQLGPEPRVFEIAAATPVSLLQIARVPGEGAPRPRHVPACLGHQTGQLPPAGSLARTFCEKNCGAEAVPAPAQVPWFQDAKEEESANLGPLEPCPAVEKGTGNRCSALGPHDFHFTLKAAEGATHA